MENTTKNLDHEVPVPPPPLINSVAGSPEAVPSDGAIDSIVDAQLRLMRMLARLVVDDLRKIAN
jgi:hypothetical protein